VSSKGDIGVSPNRITKTQEMVYEMKVGDVMTKDVLTVRPKSLMSELRSVLR